MPFSLRLIAALFLPSILFVLGCGGGEPRTVIKGALLEKGEPFILDASKLKLPAGATAVPPGSEPPLRVVFIAEGGEQFPAKVDEATGTFTVTGSNGKGIPLGKYKISVSASMGATGAKGAAGGTALDYFKGQFSKEKTQIVREIKPGEDVVIDLAKPQG